MYNLADFSKNSKKKNNNLLKNAAIGTGVVLGGVALIATAPILKNKLTPIKNATKVITPDKVEKTSYETVKAYTTRSGKVVNSTTRKRRIKINSNVIKVSSRSQKELDELRELKIKQRQEKLGADRQEALKIFDNPANRISDNNRVILYQDNRIDNDSTIYPFVGKGKNGSIIYDSKSRATLDPFTFLSAKPGISKKVKDSIIFSENVPPKTKSQIKGLLYLMEDIHPIEKWREVKFDVYNHSNDKIVGMATRPLPLNKKFRPIEVSEIVLYGNNKNNKNNDNIAGFFTHEFIHKIDSDMSSISKLDDWSSINEKHWAGELIRKIKNTKTYKKQIIENKNFIDLDTETFAQTMSVYYLDRMKQNAKILIPKLEEELKLNPNNSEIKETLNNIKSILPSLNKSNNTLKKADRYFQIDTPNPEWVNIENFIQNRINTPLRFSKLEQLRKQDLELDDMLNKISASARVENQLARYNYKEEGKIFIDPVSGKTSDIVAGRLKPDRGYRKELIKKVNRKLKQYREEGKFKNFLSYIANFKKNNNYQYLIHN